MALYFYQSYILSNNTQMPDFKNGVIIRDGDFELKNTKNKIGRKGQYSMVHVSAKLVGGVEIVSLYNHDRFNLINLETGEIIERSSVAELPQWLHDPLAVAIKCAEYLEEHK